MTKEHFLFPLSNISTQNLWWTTNLNVCYYLINFKKYLSWHISEDGHCLSGFVCFYSYAHIFILKNPKEQNVTGILSRKKEQLHLFGTFPRLLFPLCVKDAVALSAQYWKVRLLLSTLLNWNAGSSGSVIGKFYPVFSSHGSCLGKGEQYLYSLPA